MAVIVGLPPGLTLSAEGVLSGTPTAAGTYAFTVTCTDSLGNTASAALQLVVAPALSITITGLPPAVVSEPYTFTLTAIGGQPPATWTAS